MKRPDFILNEDIARWASIIDNDSNIPQSLLSQKTLREVCYCGLWLEEKLLDLKCPEILISRILFTAGKMSFGRDPWEIHIKILDDYINNKLDYEQEPQESN